jgi:formate dehydrogenase
VARFDLATAAQAGDVEEAQLQALADGLLAAERPLVWSGLGVLLSADGTVGWWLTVALQAALGLERPGSWRLQAGAVDLLKASGPLGLRGLDPSKRSRIGGYGAIMGTLAAATLADDILAEGPGQLRGLVVVGGNPALSLPDQPKVERALAHLEHLLVVDLRESDTAGFAHGFVPVKSWLSRDDIPVHTANQRSLPHLGASRALVADHRPDDWQAFAALSRAMGRPLFGSRAADALERVTGFGPREIALGAVALSAPRLLGPLRREGSAMSPPRASLRERGTAFADRRLRLAHPPFIAALGAWAPRARALSLVTSVRPTASLNTWLHQETGAKAPFATVHPEELGQRGLSAGVLTLSRPDGVSLRVEVRGDPTLRRGVVVLPFGWGHRDGRSDPGPAANRLVDTVLLEPFTGQPVSNGLTVVLSP